MERLLDRAPLGVAQRAELNVRDDRTKGGGGGLDLTAHDAPIVVDPTREQLGQARVAKKSPRFGLRRWRTSTA